MGIVGSFPGIQDINRRTIPGPINPLDKSTVVSIFPKEIDEYKHTLIPGSWKIPKGSYDKPATLVVGPSSWWKDVGEDQPLIEIPVSSVQIAESIVRDYCVGYLGSDMTDSMPGMFFVPGNFTVEQIKKDYKSLLDKAKIKQENFYRVLVRMADAYWSRTNGNPLAISDDMRMAARELGQEGKEWLADFQTQEVVRCIACGQIRNPAYPVCPHCKAVVNLEQATKLGIKFAQ